MGDEHERLEALEFLVRRYRPALVEFVRNQYRLKIDRAEDLVHGYVSDRVLKKRLFATAKESKGKFRTFLLKTIQSYIRDEMRRDSALRRRPPNGFSPLEELDEAQLPTIDSGYSEETFNVSFARQVIGEAIHRTHHICTEKQRTEVWEILYARVIGPHLEGIPAQDYGTLTAELNLSSKAEAHNRLATGKRIFQRCFRQVIEEYAYDESELIEEIDALNRLLGGSLQDSTPRSVGSP